MHSNVVQSIGRLEATGILTTPTPQFRFIHPTATRSRQAWGRELRLGREAPGPPQEAAYRSHGCEPVVDREMERSPRQGAGISQGRRQPGDAARSEKRHCPGEAAK